MLYIVFVDYLTKWPEVFATKDQSSFTIAKSLGEQYCYSTWSSRTTTFGQRKGLFVKIDV